MPSENGQITATSTEDEEEEWVVHGKFGKRRWSVGRTHTTGHHNRCSGRFGPFLVDLKNEIKLLTQTSRGSPVPVFIKMKGPNMLSTIKPYI